MKPYLLALAVALVIPACGKNLVVNSAPGMSSTCATPKVEVAAEPGDPAGAHVALIFASALDDQAPTRIFFVNVKTRCVTRAVEVPLGSIPAWQVKMGDRITSTFTGPRPPPPPPDGEPKFYNLAVQLAGEIQRGLDRIQELQPVQVQTLQK